MHKSRVTAAKLRQLARLDRCAQNHGAGWRKGLQNFRQLTVAQRSYDRKFVRNAFVFVPNVAGKHRNSGNVSLRSPTGGEESRKFGLIRDDQYAGVLQGKRLPNSLLLGACWWRLEKNTLLLQSLGFI
jgi:hypothetical protein